MPDEGFTRILKDFTLKELQRELSSTTEQYLNILMQNNSDVETTKYFISVRFRLKSLMDELKSRKGSSDYIV
jgi:hypothetical protein